MKEKIDLWNAIETKKQLQRFLNRAKQRSPRWCQGAKLYDVIKNFTNGMHYGFLDSRASAIAFQFFIALFPFLLALATLIPYLPIKTNIVQDTISNVFVSEISDYLTIMLTTLMSKPRIGLMSIAFLMLIFFSSKGISTMMRSLNNSYQDILDRPWWVTRIISFIFAIFIFLALVTIVLILAFQFKFVENFSTIHNFWGHFVIWCLKLFKLLLLMFFSITIISFIYYYSPGGEKKVFKIWSPGAFIALIIGSAAVFLFKLYLSAFNNYNYFYGALGAMIVFMILIKTFAIALIIGFEFNAAIWTAKQNIEEKQP